MTKFHSMFNTKELHNLKFKVDYSSNDWIWIECFMHIGMSAVIRELSLANVEI